MNQLNKSSWEKQEKGISTIPDFVDIPQKYGTHIKPCSWNVNMISKYILT